MRIHVYMIGAIVNLIAAAVTSVTGFGAGRLMPFWQYGALSLLMMTTYRFVEPRSHTLARIFSSVENVFVVLAIGGSIAILSYAVQTFAFPLQDDLYRAVDLFVGFDSIALITQVGTHPNLCLLMTGVYNLFLPSILAVVIAGSLWGVKFKISERAAISTMLAFVISAGLSSLFPAYGYAAFLAPELVKFVATGATPVAQLDAMRDGSMRILDLGEVRGIITFPSMHWALAIILLCTTYRLRWLFLAILPVSLGFMITALVQGGHYLADVFAGGFVGLLAVISADYILSLKFINAIEENLSGILIRLAPARIDQRSY